MTPCMWVTIHWGRLLVLFLVIINQSRCAKKKGCQRVVDFPKPKWAIFPKVLFYLIDFVRAWISAYDISCRRFSNWQCGIDLPANYESRSKHVHQLIKTALSGPAPINNGGRKATCLLTLSRAKRDESLPLNQRITLHSAKHYSINLSCRLPSIPVRALLLHKIW